MPRDFSRTSFGFLHLFAEFKHYQAELTSHFIFILEKLVSVRNARSQTMIISWLSYTPNIVTKTTTKRAKILF